MSTYTNSVAFKVINSTLMWLMVVSNFAITPQLISAQEAPSGASVWTDKYDYVPGATVNIYGEGFAANEAVVVQVVHTTGGSESGAGHEPWTIYADGAGSIATTWYVDPDDSLGANFLLTATGQSSGLVATTTFTDANQSANLDQCANDPSPSPSSDGCNSSANQWVNGNLGASKSVYLEGDSIPYRMLFDNLSLSSHTVTIEWDTTKSGKHAIDYLTSFNRTVSNANPCLGVSGCSTSTQFPIPDDPQVTGAGVTPDPGVFTMFGGTITSVSAYSYPNGTGFDTDKSARITITFTASVANPVLAWGGHISTRTDWGADGSAVNIPGSPYHSRLIELDGAGGNQDRSLSAEAVIYPASITIIKQATPDGSTSFPFTATPAPLSDFSLVDDGTLNNTKVFSGIIDFKTYSVAEVTPSGWSLTGINCSVTSANGGSQNVSLPSVSIDLREGENVTCTYSNQQQSAQLIVIKHVINNSGGQKAASDFTMHVTGNSPSPANFAGQESPGTSVTINAGSFNVTEDSVAGYTQTSAVGCSGTINPGETKTCTITNDDQPAHLKLVKVVNNNNGGSAAAADFILSAAGQTPISGAGGVESDVNAGQYDLSETSLPGYTASAWSCVGGTQNGASVTLALGESATCTITNDDTPPGLHLRKVVVTDNGGTAQATDWTLNANGPSPLTGTTPVDSDSNFVAGTYTLSESVGPSGYLPSDWVCVGGLQILNTITVGVGESATCTITNDDQAAHLKLVKTVNNNSGGNAQATDFTLSAAGPTPISGAGGAESDVTAGVYTLSETSLPGYTSGNWNCVGGTQNGASITLALGQSATCTIVNDDQPAHLKLVKVVTNDNGGSAQATDFTLSASGPTPISGAGGVESDVNAGQYNLSETSMPGYAAGSWSCVGGTQNGASITVALGQSATCTITNDDIAPSLHLRKVVVSDNGGNAQATDWTLNANGATPLSGTTPVDSNANFVAGSYTLSESVGPAGYLPSDWSCVGGIQVLNTITVGLGESATCTITNDDQPAHLKLVKTVNNDNGGNAQVSDFTLSASGPTPISGAGGAESDVNAGQYDLSETSLPGYTAGNWSCIGGTQNGASITLALGQSATCTINNDDQPAHLKLVKAVNNNNGGGAQATDFTLSASGPTPISGAGGAESDVNAGQYDLSETSLPGYEGGAWSCVGGTQNGASITLALGQSATCTITNDDQPAHLKLVKVVNNNDGGGAQTTDFTLSASGPTPISGAGGAESDVNAGQYNLSETSLPGYTSGSWNCVGGTQNGASITLALGQSATCTIVNDDQPAHLKLVKVVNNNNGGGAQATDFTLSASGPTPISGAGGAESDVNAGQYNLSETSVPGYAGGAWTCVGGTQNGASITLALGQSATCTIVNDDLAPGLHLRKVVINDNGGGAQATDWTLSAIGPTSLSGTTPVDSGADFAAGTYTLSESGPSGYLPSDWVCVGGTQVLNTITVGLGESATCTITNDDIAPILHLRKVVINDNNGQKGIADFVLTADGAGSNDLSGISPVDSGAGLQAGTFALSETNVYGYAASAWDCVGGSQSGSNITLGIGEEATCTITNNDLPGTIIIQKVTKPLNTGNFAFDTTGSGYSGFNLGGGQQDTQVLSAGQYSVTELAQAGWTLTGIGGSSDPNTPYNCTVTGSGGSSGVGDLNTMTASIDLKNGDTVTCVFENTGTGVTRTQGFWSTHPQLAKLAWDGGSGFGHTFPGVSATTGIGDKLICGRAVDNDLIVGQSELMGGFWSNIAKTTTDQKRSSIEQARAQLLQQLLAAELNASAFGSVPVGGSAKFAAWESALCNGNVNQVKNAQQEAASFNTQGDTLSFTPGTSADAKNARAYANLPFWNIISP